MFTDGIPRMQGFTRAEYEKEIAEDAMNIVFEADRPFLQDAIVYQSDVPFEYRKQEKLQKSYEEQECAEDHALNAQIIKKILENYGYQVHMQYVKA